MKKLIIALLLSTVIAAPASAAVIRPNLPAVPASAALMSEPMLPMTAPIPTPRPAHVGYVTVTGPATIIDGDTISIRHERIRLISIDTPETFRSRCENELVLGLKAKERLRELLGDGPYLLERHGLDRFGRTLGNIFAAEAEHSVSEALLKEGHALPYKPGKAAKLERLRVWCGSDATLPETKKRSRLPKAWSERLFNPKLIPQW